MTPDNQLRRTPATTETHCQVKCILIQITPQLLGLLGGAVDEGVDRLAAHGPQTAFVSGFQPARNLLGRPPFGEAVENEAPQGSVFLDQRFTPPAQLISSGGVKRRVAPAGQPIARQFA